MFQLRTAKSTLRTGKSFFFEKFPQDVLEHAAGRPPVLDGRALHQAPEVPIYGYGGLDLFPAPFHFSPQTFLDHTSSKIFTAKYLNTVPPPPKICAMG
jgi:hypothetical protein